MAFLTPSDVRVPRVDDAIKRLGRYQIIGRLATGGMAEVYLALSGELPGFRTLTVVKRILPHLASNGQFIRMFLDEARLAALLDHPNIVRIVEVGHDGEEYFLAMELVQGKPLSGVLRKAAREKRPPSPALAAFILAQAASGLAYAHGLTDGEGRALGVVHRDVSPQNILLSFEGAVKMIDFGVARAYGRVAHTSPGGLKGKIDYMSPEQASAEDVDHRADVFALGVVLWEALTGRRLFRRDTELATMRAIVDDPIPHPSDLSPVPPELDAIAMRALRKRRDGRFQSAQEMAMALEQYAFSQSGFSPSSVASYMKGLFASESLQWRRTATAALDMEVERPTDEQHPSMAALSAEPTTMALRPGAASGVSWEVRPGSDARSHGALSPARLEDERSRASAASLATDRGDRLWVYGGLGVLVAVAAAATVILARPAWLSHSPRDPEAPALAAPGPGAAPALPALPAPGVESPAGPPAPAAAPAPALAAPTAPAPASTAPAGVPASASAIAPSPAEPAAAPNNHDAPTAPGEPPTSGATSPRAADGTGPTEAAAAGAASPRAHHDRPRSRAHAHRSGGRNSP
jgi:serine/threonine protein kinase